MNHAKSRNKNFTALVCLTLSSIVFAQAPANPADKSAPKASYILAGRLFDATATTFVKTWSLRLRMSASRALPRLPI